MARENVLAQRGAYYPEPRRRLLRQPPEAVRVRSRRRPTDNALQYNLFTPQVSVSYVPDVFGLNRRTVESLKAQDRAARFQMIATYTTLTANVVVTAIQAASLRGADRRDPPADRHQYATW